MMRQRRRRPSCARSSPSASTSTSKPLILDRAARQSRWCPGSRPLGAKGDRRQIDAAVHDVQPLARRRRRLLRQPLDVELRDRHRHLGRLDLLLQEMIVHEDVVRVAGEAEGLTERARQRPRHRRRIGRPVRVDDVGIELANPAEMLDAARQRLERLGHLDRLMAEPPHDSCATVAPSARRRDGSANARRRASAACAGGSGWCTRGRSRSASGCTNFSYGGLSDRICTSAPRGDEPHQLAHDEGLRPARKQRDDVARAPPRARARHASEVPRNRLRKVLT